MTTTKEYAQYEANVAAFFAAEGLNCLSSVEPIDVDEFSWSRCDVCGDSHGGSRETMNGYNPTTNEVQDGYKVCSDCAYYVAYGQLDDMTMMDMTDDSGE